MKNITVTVGDEVYRRARVIAAEQDTSISALVKRFLESLGGAETEFERKKREELEVRDQITAFDGGNRLGRDEIHDRTRGG
jgi:predicted CopG family antitoxin